MEGEGESLDAFFDDDYAFFHQAIFAEEGNRRQVEALAALLQLEPGVRVLDLGCGYGRLSNLIAELGCYVTGLDRSERFLEMARADAERRGVNVRYVLGDMRRLPFQSEFDCVLCWFTTFGYFSDEENFQVLKEAYRVLDTEGVLMIDHQNRDRMLIEGHDSAAFRLGDDLMLDEVTYEPETGRNVIERTVVRDGQTRRSRLSIRLFSAHELMDWFRRAGFVDVGCCDFGGMEFTLKSARLIVAGRKPAKGVAALSEG